jgi:DNA adenine methylase
MPAMLAVAPVPSPLRWAGGKRWLRPLIADLIGGTKIARYHEPFLGGASVFLGLSPFSKSYLRDSNRELIDAYRVIRDRPDALAARIAEFENDKSTYYWVRGLTPESKLDRAARFIYLNHTSYNGIYRVNLQGVYNVPFGDRRAPQIPTAEHLRGVAGRLKKARLDVGDFAGSLRFVQKGDLVFLDPPYTVAHNNNGFVKYNQKLFSFEDQGRLNDLIDEIKKRRAYYILTNAAHRSIRDLFEKRGDRLIETSRRNNIGGFNAVRGSATEYLFTNLPATRA